jgi:hypothetical protein
LEFGKQKILYKFDVTYFICSKCEYVQTEEPYWLEEAYSSALSALDVGAVRRNKRFEVIIPAIVQMHFNPEGKFVDYGSGHGLFVRLMRDRGYDFHWSDKYAENLFARGFEYVNTDKPVEAVTAFEVFEHLVKPCEEIAGIINISSNVIFSTVLMPRSKPKPGHWWYYTPETGQHIGIYSETTLRWIAKEHGLHFASNGKGLHMFSKDKINPLVFKKISIPKISSFIIYFKRRECLVERDLSDLKQKTYS